MTSQVIGFQKRHSSSGAVLDDVALDMPEQRLRTAGCWWALPDDLVAATGLSARRLPGAAHAAEHAAIGMLPLFATCDRWDVGGVSTARHPDTDKLTVVVHDAAPGGAGFAARGYDAMADWLVATRDAIAACGCDQGCPACVQSPKCGNGNSPLDKSGAVTLLTTLLAQYPGLTGPAHASRRTVTGHDRPITSTRTGTATVTRTAPSCTPQPTTSTPLRRATCTASAQGARPRTWACAAASAARSAPVAALCRAPTTPAHHPATMATASTITMTMTASTVLDPRCSPPGRLARRRLTARPLRAAPRPMPQQAPRLLRRTDPAGVAPLPAQ